MNNRERFMTALKLGQPDRIPYTDTWFNEESILKVGKYFVSDLPPMKYFFDCSPEEVFRFYDVQMKVVKELDLDAITVGYSTRTQRVVGEKDAIKDCYGIVYRVTEHGEPFPVAGPLNDANDLKRFKATRPTHADFGLLQYVREKMPERVVMVSLPDPFKFCWSLLGAMERLLVCYVTDSEFCLELTRIATDFLKEVIEMSIDEKAEIILLEGDLAYNSDTLMSPDHYRKFIKPYQHALCEVAHKKGVPIIKHTDGNAWSILDDLVEVGFDGIHPVQPQCMEIKKVKEHLKGKCCVLGNIDCSFLLPFGTEEEVIENVKDTIRRAAPGGGYILTSSNSIHPGCKGENVISMFRTAMECGSYPIKIDEFCYQ